MIAMESEDSKQILEAVKQLIRACTFEKVDPDKLCLFDLEYLFLKLRSKAVGEVAKIGLKCEKCGKPTDVEINLDKVEVDLVNKPSNKIKLTDTIGVTLSWPRVGNVQSLQDGNAIGITLAIDVIVSCIDSIYDAKSVHLAADQKPEELVAFVESLNQAQFTKIQEFIAAMPKLTHTVNFTCNHAECVKKRAEEGLLPVDNVITLQGMQSFFA